MPRSIRETLSAYKPERSVEQKEQQLRHDMSDLQLRFAEQLWQRSAHGDTSFVDVVYQNTSLFSRAVEAANDPRQPTPGETRLAALFHNINQIHATHDSHWKEDIYQAITSAERAWRIDQPEKKRRQIGSFYFDFSVCADIPHIPPEEDALELHVESAFKTNSTLHLRDIHQHLEQIAVMVANEFPYIKAVRGTSWLMDHPIAKRLGFHLTNTTRPLNDQSVWSQFVDKDGTLNTRRANELLQTSKPPFVSRLGYMTVEEFLERYLPADRRAQPVQLMNVDPVWRDKQKHIDEEVRHLRDQWESLSIESIEPTISLCTETMRFLRDIHAAKPFLRLLQEAKRANLTWDATMRAPQFVNIIDHIKRTLSAHKYRPGKVLHLHLP